MSSNSSESPIDFEKANENDTIIELQLGDVIKITNPLNDKLNNQTFIIDYIDKLKTFLINVDTIERIKLKINEDGIIGDGNIVKIALLSRSETASYAKQNDLLPGKWINIYFGGEFPVILTGEITNLEEDMIEVRTIDGDILYINFDYKGLPEDLPIENIEIREKPQKPRKPEILEDEGEILEEGEEARNIEENLPELARHYETMATEKIEIAVPTKNIKNQLKEFILRADQIKFGDEELGPIVQYVDVKEHAQRYSIEVQVSDLLDELLSTIPNAQRTPRVLNNIHIIIERFKQLREHFSNFDQYGNINSAVVVEATTKPLETYFRKFKQNLYWILPVVKNIKKVYDVNQLDSEENPDIVNIQLNTDLAKIDEIIQNYESNTMPTEQNNYSALYNDLTPSFTPFDLIGDENNSEILAEKKINCDLNVIIDNLEDMYSSIFSQNNIRTRRFVIERYNLGLTKLNTLNSTSSRLITARVNMTPNEILSIKSFITLPEPAIKFSTINLPGSTLIDKANLNLHFLNYWEFLKKKTQVNYILVDELNKGIEFNDSNFANDIKSYIIDLTSDDLKGLTNSELYKKFINVLIPKIKVLFNLMKKYITGRLSIVDVVSYLEPFLIYTEDLSYMQYIEITKFISEQISKSNQRYAERSRMFMMLNRVKSTPIITANAYSLINILSTKNSLRENVIEEGYDLQDVEKVFTNSEILRKIILKDYSKLYTTALSLQNVPLMFPSEFSNLFDEEKKKNDSLLKNEQEKDSCKTMTLSKYYKSLDSLNADNGKIIYFDKKYDKTNYGILDNYEKEIIKLTPEELLIHITKDLMNKNKLTEQEANYLANTLLDGHKKVIDGQYAILYKGYNQNSNEEVDYYVRRDNKWELDNDMSKIINSTESSILCNLQEKCISVPTNNNMDDKCESIKVDELGIQNKLLKDVINEFDTRYKISKEDFEKEIKEKYDYFSDIIGVLSKMETNSMLKFNNQKYKLGANIDEDPSIKPISPNQKLLNLILNQKDFVKKQQDIIKFVNIYTRPPVEGFGPLNERESQFWLYCLISNVPLLPRFKFELAAVFVNDQPNYLNQLEIIKSRIGKLSDDGDWWTDEHSGWPICHVDFDVEEGYEEGFKITTRSVMEDDAGNKIMSSETEKSIIYNTPQTKMISNIINALSVAMGINMENQKEFIINCVITAMSDTLESESDYKEKIRHMAEKGSKMPSYKDFYNMSLLYYTLGMFLIATQTAIPSIKTRKTHPGCIRSFHGYPYEGAGDLSSLNYVACVAYDIRESGEPWNVLRKRETVISKLKKTVDEVLLNLSEVKRKFEEKTDYLLTNPATAIPNEHDIAKWSQFLPPLVPFKIRHLVNISEEFKKTLTRDLRNGVSNQNESILVVCSKIIKFSLAIQEEIGNVVKNNHLLLHNSNNEPYLENACCQTEGRVSTIDYFIDKKPIIEEYNQIVTRLTNIIEDITSYGEASLLYSDINTKNIYPPLSNQFNEKTIYMAFIYFCKFKSLALIPNDLIPICTGKPESTLINPNDSLDRIIKKLKDDGRNYTNDQFLRLLQIIGRSNIVNINFDITEISTIARLLDLINSINDANDDVVEPSLRELITSALDTYDIANQESTREVKDLNNFLIKQNELMREEIIEFIEKNSGSKITRSSIKKAREFINNLSVWSTDESTRNEDIKISNDKMYNIVNFYKTFIENFVSIFPNIILNNVDHNSLFIPSYFGFSANHIKKLKTYFKNYYEKLNTFYGVPILQNILTTIQKTSLNLNKMAKETPSFSTIKIGDKIFKPVFDERTSRFLFEYYLLRVLINYIELSDNEEMIVTEVRKEQEITDLFAVEYIEERDTRVDLSVTRSETETILLFGNKKELRQNTSQLLVAFIEIMRNHKDTINISYEEIQDSVFKLREKEKNSITDRLKNLTDEERNIDTILKINKLNQYSKGLQKGLTVLDKNFYDEEQEFRDEMTKAETIIRKKNKNATDDDIEQLIEDYTTEQAVNDEIEEEVNDMEYMNEDFYNGNTDGTGAPEEEYDDYNDFDA